MLAPLHHISQGRKKLLVEREVLYSIFVPQSILPVMVVLRQVHSLSAWICHILLNLLLGDAIWGKENHGLETSQQLIRRTGFWICVCYGAIAKLIPTQLILEFSIFFSS